MGRELRIEYGAISWQISTTAHSIGAACRHLFFNSRPAQREVSENLNSFKTSIMVEVERGTSAPSSDGYII